MHRSIDDFVVRSQGRTSADVLASAAIFGVCLLGGGLLVAIKLVF